MQNVTDISYLSGVIDAARAARAAGDGTRPTVIAIDGRCASGKTTAAELLRGVLGASVVHVDDFFLPPDLRSPERYAAPGENFHHERFRTEVLPQLRRADGFSYRRFDCHVMDYNGSVEVPAAPFVIVEGSYSHHPCLGDYADLKVFFTVDSGEQIRRITERGGAEAAARFRERWIPLEERYFSHFGIAERADFVIVS